VGIQSLYGHFGDEKHVFIVPGFQPRYSESRFREPRPACFVTRTRDISLMHRGRKALFLSTFLFLASFFFPCSPSQLIHNQASETASPPRIAVAFNPSSTPLHFHQQPPPHKLFSAFFFLNTELQNKRPDKVLTFFHRTTYLILWRNKKKRNRYLYA
jgi:hypothetical protein